MTTVEAAARIGIQPHKVSEYCKRGIIDCTWRPRGRQAREYDISEAQLARYLATRTTSTRSARATEQWRRRRQAQHGGGHLPSAAEMDAQATRQAAFDGDEDAKQELSHLRWWWNRAKGVIVGSVTMKEIREYAERAWAARPMPGPLPAYIPGEWRR